MTYKQLQDEVIGLRFDETNRTSVKSWINRAYASIWNRADWDFKYVPRATFTLTSGSRTPTMPAEFGKALDVFDTNNAPLLYVSPQDFDYVSLNSVSSSSGLPDTYTVINRQIYLDPVPSANSSFKLSYKRRLAHVDASTGITGGIMVEDADQPLWSAEHDYVLVLEACIIGGGLLDDLGSAGLATQRDEAMAAMIADLTWDQEGQTEQWQNAELGNAWGSW